VQLGGRPQRGHSYVVHRGEARPDHGAALFWIRITVHDRHPEPDGSYRGQERNCGQTGIVVYRKTRLKGQLGNEIGSPHARAEDRGRHEQPWKGPVPRRVIRTNEQIHGYQASGNANQCGEGNEPEIMLSRKTVINALHRASLLASDNGSGEPASGTFRLFSPQMCQTAVAFRCSGMCNFYVVCRLSRRPALSRAPNPD
jgi:hypothetical protein